MPSVLIVDSDEQMVRLLSWILVEAGFEVTAISDRGAAAERFKTYTPDVAVLRTAAGGSEARAEIDGWRELAPDTRILQIAYRADARRSGADRALPMPFHADALIDCIHTLIGIANDPP